jgi:transposase-like protein
MIYTKRLAELLKQMLVVERTDDKLTLFNNIKMELLEISKQKDTVRCPSCHSLHSQPSSERGRICSLCQTTFAV